MRYFDEHHFVYIRFLASLRSETAQSLCPRSPATLPPLRQATAWLLEALLHASRQRIFLVPGLSRFLACNSSIKRASTFHKRATAVEFQQEFLPPTSYSSLTLTEACIAQ